MPKKQGEIKVIALGASGVGKSCILTRFIQNRFNISSEITLGAAFVSKTYKYDSKEVKFQIWDTAGQQKYRSIAPIYYKDAQVALCVYDITSKQSFKTMKSWVQELKTKGPRGVLLAVVGNKIDCTDDEQVKYLVAKQYADEINAIFKLTSAKEGKGINQLFTAIAKKLQQNAHVNPRNTFLISNGSNDSDWNSRRCCV